MTVRRLSISVPPEVEEHIRAAAAAKDLPVSAWLSQVAEHAAIIQEGLRGVEEFEAEHGPLPEEARRWARQVLEEDGVITPQEERIAS